jgi:hypothetical protein
VHCDNITAAEIAKGTVKKITVNGNAILLGHRSGKTGVL